jgi:hypothetical protein
LEEAKKIADLPIECTGIMGKRTKYQYKEVAQLTLDFATRETTLEIHEENSTLKNEEMPITA